MVVIAASFSTGARAVCCFENDIDGEGSVSRAMVKHVALH
jgi:hypothetical protein